MIGRGHIVTMTPGQVAVRDFVARERYITNQQVGAQHKTELKDGRDPVHQNIMGVGGEFGFAQMVNVYPDLTTHCRKGGYDGKLQNGLSYDVKCVPHWDNPLLYLELAVKGRADLYVLIATERPLSPKYKFIGWISDKDLALYRPDPVKHKWILHPDQLKDAMQTAADFPGCRSWSVDPDDVAICR
jgi:hypothetical protein